MILALLLLSGGCCRVPTLLFQSHAETPAWVRSVPPPSGAEVFFVGRVWARDRLDEGYVLKQARKTVADQIAGDGISGDVMQAPGAEGIRKIRPVAAAELATTLKPREIYWEQWQRVCALSFSTKQYLYYLLFAVPRGDLERLLTSGPAAPAP